MLVMTSMKRTLAPSLKMPGCLSLCQSCLSYLNKFSCQHTHTLSHTGRESNTLTHQLTCLFIESLPQNSNNNWVPSNNAFSRRPRKQPPKKQQTAQPTPPPAPRKRQKELRQGTGSVNNLTRPNVQHKHNLIQTQAHTHPPTHIPHKKHSSTPTHPSTPSDTHTHTRTHCLTRIDPQARRQSQS